MEDVSDIRALAETKINQLLSTVRALSEELDLKSRKIESLGKHSNLNIYFRERKRSEI